MPLRVTFTLYQRLRFSVPSVLVLLSAEATKNTLLFASVADISPNTVFDRSPVTSSIHSALKSSDMLPAAMLGALCASSRVTAAKSVFSEAAATVAYEELSTTRNSSPQ